MKEEALLLINNVFMILSMMFILYFISCKSERYKDNGGLFANNKMVQRW